LPQGVESALVKIAQMASDLALFCRGQREDEKGKKLGQETQKIAVGQSGRLKGGVRILR
jgi:hypothetical protein